HPRGRPPRAAPPPARGHRAALPQWSRRGRCCLHPGHLGRDSEDPHPPRAVDHAPRARARLGGGGGRCPPTVATSPRVAPATSCWLWCTAAVDACDAAAVPFSP